IRFEIINDDPEELLYQPVSIYFSIDGAPGRKVVMDVMPSLPVEPGEGFLVELEDYVFNPLDFAALGGGGNVSHDIIVWPMKVALIDNDSSRIQVDYFSDPVFSMEEGIAQLPPAINPNETYNIYLAAKNIGAHTNGNPVNFYIQLDDNAPLLYEQVNLTAEPDFYVSTASADFTFSTYFGIAADDSSYFSVSHTLTFFAMEQNGLNWYEATIHTVNPFDNEYSTQSTTNMEAESRAGDEPVTGAFNLSEAAYQPYSGFTFSKIQNANPQPNPFRDQLEIRSLYQIEGDVYFQLYDLQHQPVMEKRWKIGSRSKSLLVDTSSLLPGVYFYQLELNGSVFNGKIIRE
ncbi:MAG: T9SS type A sorting domain-containing protein, partial [Bacteroidota bacterium]